MKTLPVALASVILSVAAQFLLKAGMSGEQARALGAASVSFRSMLAVLSIGYVLAGLALYGMGACVWLIVLSRWDVSKAYPLVGLGFVFTPLIGFLLGEHVTVWRVVGVSLICSGVVLIARM